MICVMCHMSVVMCQVSLKLDCPLYTTPTEQESDKLNSFLSVWTVLVKFCIALFYHWKKLIFEIKLLFFLIFLHCYKYIYIYIQYFVIELCTCWIYLDLGLKLVYFIIEKLPSYKIGKWLDPLFVTIH